MDLTIIQQQYYDNLMKELNELIDDIELREHIIYLIDSLVESITE